jgi:hypothetical protein
MPGRCLVSTCGSFTGAPWRDDLGPMIRWRIVTFLTWSGLAPIWSGFSSLLHQHVLRAKVTGDVDANSVTHFFRNRSHFGSMSLAAPSGKTIKASLTR